MSLALALQTAALVFTILAAVCAFWAYLISEKGENIVSYLHEKAEFSAGVQRIDPIMIELVYKEPALTSDDVCENGICKGEYTLVGESIDSIRIDSPRCKEFITESYNFDSGPYNLETGNYKRLISDRSGKEVRTCGWIDIPKDRVVSRQNTSYQTSTEKRVWNYDTVDEFGSKIVQ